MPQSAQNFAPGALSELQFEQRFDSGLPHSAQNFLLGIPSVPHFEQRILCSQLVEQGFGVFEVCGVEALGEPAVDFGEHRLRFITTALRCEQAREAYRCAQLPGLRLHFLGERDRVVEVGLGQLGLAYFEPQLAA